MQVWRQMRKVSDDVVETYLHYLFLAHEVNKTNYVIPYVTEPSCA